MIIKFRSVKNSINNLVLRFQRKGCKSYPVYSIVVLHKNSKVNKGKVICKIGFYNPNFSEKIFFLDKLTLYIFISKGAKISCKHKHFLIKLLVNLSN